MLARCTTYVLDGITAHPVTVECDVRPGLPSFTVLGLPDVAARDLRETVRAAVQNSGHPFPQRRVSVNIAPAWLRRSAPSLTLAVAVAVLAAAGEIPADQVAGIAVYGALTLGGEITPLPGTLAAAAAHRSSGLAGPLLYAGAPLPSDVTPDGSLPVSHLTELPCPEPTGAAPAAPAAPVRAWERADYADVRGHDDAVFALTVAAAGGHHVLMRGAPGSGAVMLARRLVTILPELTAPQQHEVAAIRDAAGLGRDRDRPFRAPHHTISAAGLVGGGSPLRPGEMTLSHRGVLYLADLDAFARATLDALRAPLQDQTVAIVRGTRAYTLPASFQLVASASPCPCGHGNTGGCSCDAGTLARHQRRLSGPLFDRFAIVLDLPPTIDAQGAPPAPSSAELRARVLAARERRNLQRADAPHGDPSAAAANPSGCLSRLSRAADAALDSAYRGGALTPRGRRQILDVARTVADLAGEDAISVDALDTALALRGHHPAPAPSLAC
jgi:magnesium chelatase family protein